MTQQKPAYHKSRRAQGLPITTIIIAAIGIIVLVILIVIVQQRTTMFGTGLKETTGNCPGEKGTIGDDCDVIYGSFKDIQAGEICCKQGTLKK